MGYRKREWLQTELVFDPQPLISLPTAARQEAVAALAALIAEVMGETDRAAKGGGRDD